MPVQPTTSSGLLRNPLDPLLGGLGELRGALPPLGLISGLPPLKNAPKGALLGPVRPPASMVSRCGAFRITF